MRRAPTLLKPVSRPPAPETLVTPPIAASLGINHRQVYVSRGRLLVVIRNGVFGDVTVVNGVPVWPLAKIMLPPL